MIYFMYRSTVYIIQVYCRDFRVDEFIYYYWRQEEINSAVAHIVRQLFSPAVFCVIWVSAGIERVRCRIIIHVWAHMYVFMHGITAFMISSNEFSRGAQVNVLWYSLGIFFWGLILLLHESFRPRESVSWAIFELGL